MGITELKKIAKYAGMREDLVQAGGGNASVKVSADEMLIKASGYQMAEIEDGFGYASVNYPKIAAFLTAHETDMLTEEDGAVALHSAVYEGERPSIETFLHAITGRVTLHTHPMVVNVLLSTQQRVETLHSLFPEALIVGYATPGIRLAQLYFSTYQHEKRQRQVEFSVIFLRNHGLVVSGETADEVIRQTEDILDKTAEALNVDISAYRNATFLYDKLAAWGVLGERQIVYLSTDVYIKEALHRFPRGWDYAFCPDCLVYCGRAPLFLGDLSCFDDVKDYIDKEGRPVILLYQKNVYILADTVAKAKEIESVLRFSAQVVMLNQGYAIELLSREEQNFLLHWEAEEYRRSRK